MPERKLLSELVATISTGIPVYVGQATPPAQTITEGAR